MGSNPGQDSGTVKGKFERFLCHAVRVILVLITVRMVQLGLHYASH